ncbi:glycoside hydrolase family 38 C-terminal domain-containing protein [Schumannella luteola]
MIQRAVTSTGTVGGRALQIIGEPLLATVDGRGVQSLRVLLGAVDSPDEDATAPEIVVTVDGERIDRATRPAEPGSIRVLVDAVTSETTARLAVPAWGDDAIEVELVPQREWTVHMVHHSHYDFGYTDPQAEVMAAQRSYLDSAIDLIEQTADWPEESRFRWNSEALWAVSDWESHRPQAVVDRFMQLVKQGSIGLSAMPYNLHTDVCSTDELRELMREARRLRDRYGIEFTSAMQTDVPGQVAGLPDALNEMGVRYLSVAHNWAGRSEPHTHGAINHPRLFRWRTLAGGEVLVWMTDSPHGLAYMEGPMLGFTEDFAQVQNYLPAYLTAMSERGYPFPIGVFGAHGETIEGRDPYPWDVVHIRTQGFMGDNGPARRLLSEIVREWNDTWDAPKLRVSTNQDFFEDAESRVGDDLTTVEGDWGDWWVEGVGSAAVPMALMRRAQAQVADARSISQLAGWLGGESSPRETAEAHGTYDAISMFNEHTWGAGNSWLHSDHGFDSGELQWRWKVAQALIGEQRSRASVDESLAYLGAAVAPADDALASFAIVNPTGLARSGAVRLLLPETVAALEAQVDLVDSRSGNALPLSVEAQSNHPHRESGRWLTVRVDDVPAFGTVRLDARERVGDDRPRAIDDPSVAEPGYPSEVPMTELLRLENDHLTVVVDLQRSGISSIVERATGRELVRADALVPFNGYVYDEYASSGAGFNHLANKLATSDRLEMLATRQMGLPARLVERRDDAIEQRLVYEFRAAGAERVRVTLRLRHGDARLLIENSVAKPSVLIKESAYFGFPFAGDDAQLRYEVSGSVTGAGLPHIPGAPQHMRAMRDWVTVTSGDDVVVWATPDVPLVQPHTIAVPYSPFPPSTSPSEPGTVYSWLHNNLWDTNFPIEQGFDSTFRYAVGVRATPEQSVEEVAIATAAELAHPLRAARARGAADAHAGTHSGLGLSDARVKLIAVVADDEGSGSIVRLQSFADEPVRLTLTLGRSAVSATRSTFLGDMIADLVVDDAGDTVTVELARFEATAVHLRF